MRAIQATRLTRSWGLSPPGRHGPYRSFGEIIVLIGVQVATPHQLSEHLKSLRADLGMTLEELSQAAGVSVRGISDIERGVTATPRASTLRALAQALGLDRPETSQLIRMARNALASPTDVPETVRPSRLRDFAGRAREMIAIGGLLEERGAVVLINGPAGFGKTSLAVELADRTSQGREFVFVDASGHGREPLSALEILRRILLQVDDEVTETQANLHAAVSRWSYVSKAKKPLVLVDSVVTEDQVRPLLAAEDRGPILLTSRRTIAGLSVSGRIQLDALDYHSSLRLLNGIIPSGQRTQRDIDDLVTICEGVPLALRIAGNRIASRPSTSANDYVTRMRSEERRLSLLVAGDMSVESAFIPSYEDLDPSSAALFRSLALIDGTTFDAVIAAVASGQSIQNAEDGLEHLVDLSMVESRGGSRYRLHDLVRLFAASRLSLCESSRAEAARKRLSYWMLATALAASNMWAPEYKRTLIPDSWKVEGIAVQDVIAKQDMARHWVMTEAGNWQTALRRVAELGDHESVDLVVTGLQSIYRAMTEWDGWHPLNELGLRSAEALGDPRKVSAHLANLSWTWITQKGDPMAGLAAAQRSLEAASSVGDRELIASAHCAIAWIYIAISQPDPAVDHIDAAVSGFTRSGSRGDLYRALAAEVTIKRMMGKYADAAKQTESVLSSISPLPITGEFETEEWGVSVARTVGLEENVLANIALGNLDQARESISKLLAIAAVHDLEILEARTLVRRANVGIALGDLEAAKKDLDDVSAITTKYPGNAHAELIAAEVAATRIQMRETLASNE